VESRCDTLQAYVVEILREGTVVNTNTTANTQAEFGNLDAATTYTVTVTATNNDNQASMGSASLLTTELGITTARNLTCLML